MATVKTQEKEYGDYLEDDCLDEEEDIEDEYDEHDD